MLIYQEESCELSLKEGIEEYRKYLKTNNNHSLTIVGGSGFIGKSIIDSFIEKPLIITGDFNVVHKEKDIWNPATYKKGGSPGVLKEEIQMFDEFIENYIDCYRMKYPEGNKYSWWDMRSKGREKGRGWRIDYFLIQSKFLLLTVTRNLYTAFLI